MHGIESPVKWREMSLHKYVLTSVLSLKLWKRWWRKRWHRK